MGAHQIRLATDTQLVTGLVSRHQGRTLTNVDAVALYANVYKAAMRRHAWLRTLEVHGAPLATDFERHLA